MKAYTMLGRTNKGRSNWFRAAVVLGALGAVAVAAPALGGPSLKSLVKKEVAKQISKATGPAGANGTNGTNGAAGADGTARAYVRVDPSTCAGGPEMCTPEDAKGVTAVERTSTGVYCITATGIDASTVPAAVTVDHLSTADPEGNASAMTSGSTCTGQRFLVLTERHVDSTGTDASPTNSVGFTVVIP